MCKEKKLKNTMGETKEEVVVAEVVEEEEEGEEVKKKANETTSSLPHKQEEEDECPICIEPLQKDTNKFVRMTCCGKGMHIWCYKGLNESSSLNQEQKNRCPLCRTKRPNSEEESAQQIRPWLEKGKAWAQSLTANSYNREQLYNQQAVQLYELAARQGDARAQFRLGIFYSSALRSGAVQSDEKAKTYFKAAAIQGLAVAQSHLGVEYVTSKGVEQDINIETARMWWMKAAEQGEESAIKHLQQLDLIEGMHFSSQGKGDPTMGSTSSTPSFVPKPFECATCYRPHDPSEHKLRPCKRCHRVYYCGKECQMEHWKLKGVNGHKFLCDNKKQMKKDSQRMLDSYHASVA